MNHGEFMMYHLHTIGGMTYFIDYLIKVGIINGDCLTVTGKTLKENCKNFLDNYKYKLWDFNDQIIIKSIKKPFKYKSHKNFKR